MFRTASATSTFAALFLSGCGGQDLPGNYFDVRLVGVEDQCTGGNASSYTEELEYRLSVVVNDATLAIGDDVFATGTLEGCQLTYTSLVWTDSRGTDEVTWQIVGEARVDLIGGEGCAEGSSDWTGTETFVVLSSNAADVAAGCTYDLTVDGTFAREVE